MKTMTFDKAYRQWKKALQPLKHLDWLRECPEISHEAKVIINKEIQRLFPRCEKLRQKAIAIRAEQTKT